MEGHLLSSSLHSILMSSNCVICSGNSRSGILCTPTILIASSTVTAHQNQMEGSKVGRGNGSATSRSYYLTILVYVYRRL